MKKFLVCLVPFFLSGCGAVNKSCASFSGHSYECVDGVTYVQFSSGAAPLYTLDGKLVSCRDSH